jgi:hypothetical protein
VRAEDRVRVVVRAADESIQFLAGQPERVRRQRAELVLRNVQMMLTHW